MHHMSVTSSMGCSTKNVYITNTICLRCTLTPTCADGIHSTQYYMYINYYMSLWSTYLCPQLSLSWKFSRLGIQHECIAIESILSKHMMYRTKALALHTSPSIVCRKVKYQKSCDICHLYQWYKVR